MDADDPPERGYDPQMDRTADPHGPGIGADATEQSYRLLLTELTSARTIRDLVGTMRRYGWIPPLVGLLCYGLVRGLFAYASEPFAMSEGYIFTGWPIALVINLVYGVFFAGFTWFLYFGVIGSLAGFFSETVKMETTMFKAGGYFSVFFVPVMLVASGLALTIPAPESVVAGAEPTTAVIETHEAVAVTTQMQVADVLIAGTWIVVGFLMLPVVEELYEISRKASVLSVLPVTLVAVVATQLV